MRLYDSQSHHSSNYVQKEEMRPLTAIYSGSITLPCITLCNFPMSNHLEASRLLEGRANGTELDVREGDLGVRSIGLNILRGTRSNIASTTADTGLGGVLISREGRVEPEHVDCVVVPEGHDEDVALCEGRGHLVETTLLFERVVVAEVRLLLLAELVGDGVSADLGVGGLGGGVDLAVLDPEALDFAEGGAGADELRDDGHLLVGVDGLAGAVEVGDTHAVGL